MTNEIFAQLVQQYEKLVFTICYQFTQDYHEAQNLMQDTFVAAFTHIDSVREDNLKAWLARIAANKAKDYLKSAYNRRVSLSEDLSEFEQRRMEESPENLYVDEEGRETIEQAVMALPEPYHKVSILFFLKDKSVEEIADILDRPKKTVQTQLYRARIRLQELIREEMSTG